MNVGAYIRVSTVFEEQDTSVINQEEGLTIFRYIPTNRFNPMPRLRIIHDQLPRCQTERRNTETLLCLRRIP